MNRSRQYPHHKLPDMQQHAEWKHCAHKVHKVKKCLVYNVVGKVTFIEELKQISLRGSEGESV